jgi:hypothetical protein
MSEPGIVKFTRNSTFEERYVPEPNSGCWLWLGPLDAYGYGILKCKGDKKKAHRESWRRNKGEILGDLHICHKCDNRCCVNPDHLFLGTNADNVADCIEKGRTNKGEKHRDVKLTETQVSEIRASTLSQRKLAKIYGVFHTTISHIRCRRNWKHIKE